MTGPRFAPRSGLPDLGYVKVSAGFFTNFAKEQAFIQLLFVKMYVILQTI